MDVTEDRMATLERRVRTAMALWVLSLVGLLVLGVGALQVSSQSAPQAETVLTATAVKIVDSSGRERLWLGVDNGGQPQMALYDSEHTRRITIALQPDGRPSIQVLSTTGVKLAELIQSPTSGNGSLWLYDTAGTGRVFLGHFNNTSDHFGIGTYDSAGHWTWGTP
jgi:hypothetical protein